MARGGKYANLRGTIPELPTERDEVITAALAERAGKSITELTFEYNQTYDHIKALADESKPLERLRDALQILIREHVIASGQDFMGINGYTWTPSGTPFPIAASPEKIVQYFKDHDMEDQLQLSKSELVARVTTFVKDEAAAGLLEIREVEETNATTGEVQKVSKVFSRIPGVEVFLKPALGRAKQGVK